MKVWQKSAKQMNSVAWIIVGIVLILPACTHRPYRPESIDAKMQRYEGQQAPVRFAQWQVDPTFFTHRVPAAATFAPSTPPLTRPLGQIYFLSLVEQYYQLGQFLPEGTAPIKICANFHDVLVREALYPPPVKKSFILPAPHELTVQPQLYPFGQLPYQEGPLRKDEVALAEGGPVVAVVWQQHPQSLIQQQAILEQALRLQQQRLFAEIWQLCDAESAHSINRDNFLNLVRFKQHHPLTPTAPNVAVLFKILPLNNWALLDSLGEPVVLGAYTQQVMQALGANWLQDYLKFQREKRKQRTPAATDL